MFEQGRLGSVVCVHSARTEFLRSFQQHHKRSSHWNSAEGSDPGGGMHRQKPQYISQTIISDTYLEGTACLSEDGAIAQDRH